MSKKYMQEPGAPSTGCCIAAGRCVTLKSFPNSLYRLRKTGTMLRWHEMVVVAAVAMVAMVSAAAMAVVVVEEAVAVVVVEEAKAAVVVVRAASMETAVVEALVVTAYLCP